MDRYKGLGEEARKFSIDKQRRLIASVQENILLDTPINRPPHYAEVILEYMSQGNFWPIIAGTHKAHPAGFPPIEEAAYIQGIANTVLPQEQQINGSLLLIANTMHKGQSTDIVEGLKGVQPIFDQYNTEPLAVLRKKDAKGLNEAEKRDYQKKLFSKIGNVVANGQIPIILPEATVESGRQKPGGIKGDIKGMVYLESDSIAFLSQMIRRQKKEPLLFFIGTTGENRIYDPITEQVTTEAKVTALGRAIPPVRLFLPPIMSSIVDYPTSYAELEQAYGTNGRLYGEVPEWICGERLAQLIPLTERGVFDQPELLDMAPQIRRRDTRDLF